METERIKSSGLARKFFFYTFVILIPLIIFFSLAELMARLLAPSVVIPNPPPLSAIDPHNPNPYIFKARPYLFFHIPGSEYIQSRPNIQVKYEINSQGFRGPEIPLQKPDKMKRLLVIGDSVVEGYGVEFTQTFTYRLGENLQPFGWEVFNVGVQGGDPLYYAANVERYLALNPDAVLIVLYENDIPEGRVREDEYFKLPYLDNPDSLFPYSYKTSNILSISRFYTVLQKEWWKLNKSPVEQIIMQNQKTLATDLEKVRLLISSPDRVPSSFLDQQWDKSRLYLDLAVSTFQNIRCRSC
ncbi:MAG: SGNH/GDSL hydrolase family protein [Anaerolineae bacterium]